MNRIVALFTAPGAGFTPPGRGLEVLRRRSVQLLLVLVLAGAGAGCDRGLDTARFAAVEGPLQRPDFSLATIDGGSRSVSQWDGQVLLVDFWASWCLPCRREMPTFDALRAMYGEQGFEVVGLAADSLEQVREFVAEVPVDFPIVYGEPSEVIAISVAYGNIYRGLPFSAFVDREGNIRYIRKPGEVSFEEAEEILLRLL